MDKEVLVKSGTLLVKELDAELVPPRAAVWMHATDLDTWKLWVVPHRSLSDSREFYRRLSEIVTKLREDLGGIDAADAEIVPDQNLVLQGLQIAARIKDVGAIFITSCVFNGVFVQEAIILRLDL